MSTEFISSDAVIAVFRMLTNEMQGLNDNVRSLTEKFNHEDDFIQLGPRVIMARKCITWIHAPPNSRLIKCAHGSNVSEDQYETVQERDDHWRLIQQGHFSYLKRVSVLKSKGASPGAL